ncbi:hypothetical protein Scep_016813 [Stephania cephalantha]|uniref:Uncharacterized protein n=1 Tax=Stephania cephalantha TaxID=152367 RepID=A0AAP0NV24_9MAGN
MEGAVEGEIGGRCTAVGEATGKEVRQWETSIGAVGDLGWLARLVGGGGGGGRRKWEEAVEEVYGLDLRCDLEADAIRLFRISVPTDPYYYG